MQKKITIYFLAFLVLLVALASSIQDDALSLQQPYQFIERFSGIDALVLMPNFRMVRHDFLRLGTGHYISPLIFNHPVDIIWSVVKCKPVVVSFCSVILLFFIFYQLARTGRKADDPVSINGLCFA